MEYARCGNSGLRLSRLSLGFWHNHGDWSELANSRALIRHAFDAGITCFDLANNYGPPPGHAEKVFGRIVTELPRDQIIVATKAGYEMWAGPYGDRGSRKHLIASIDQSLRRLNLDYVDIFYHHRPDPETPIEETMGALHHIVQSGRALYVAVSNYSLSNHLAAAQCMNSRGEKIIANQIRGNVLSSANLEEYSSANTEAGLLVYSPLAQGLLSEKYLDSVPDGSRASRTTWDPGDLKPNNLTPQILHTIRRLASIAGKKGQTLSETSIAWLASKAQVTSIIIGPRTVHQLSENVAALSKAPFLDEDISFLRDQLSGETG